MIKSYFTIAWRNMKRNQVFAIINIFGLTIGVTVCMMIFLFVRNEFTFDKFHQQEKNIYRLVRSFDENGAEKRVPWLSPPFATTLPIDFPEEVKKTVRVRPSNALVTFGTVSFNEKKVLKADNDFFTFFSYPLIAGNAATALGNPASIVLTESTAKKYFGNEDPLGKVVELDKNLRLTVTGIAKDIPTNSHLDFDLVVPLANYSREDAFQNWFFNNLFTYVLLDEHTGPSSLESRFSGFIQKHMGQQFAKIGLKFKLSLTPLSAIYFESSSASDPTRHGNRTMVYIFVAIALLILLIACVNFINLSTIKAIERSKEVGLRKVMGAIRSHLAGQFISESILTVLISSLISIGLVKLLNPFYAQLLGYTLDIPWSTWHLYAFFAGIILIVGLLAGSYPAFFISGFSPVQALKGKLRLGKGGSTFRQALVTLQFGISILLVIGVVVISSQLKYMKTKELGYKIDHVVSIRVDNNNDIYRGRRQLKEDLQDNTAIKEVSLMSGEPGGFHDSQTFQVEGTDDRTWSLRTQFADFEYIETLGLKMIAGRDFSASFKTDTTNSVLINRTAAATLGYTPEQAIGKWIQNTIRDHSKRIIIGVVEDFNFLSLKDKVEPLVISPNEDNRVALIALKPGSIKEGMKAIEREYRKLAPDYPFEYSFLDQNFDKLYRKDIQQQTLMSIFSALSIFVASLGLYGLASFTTAKRTKEIGIRKVLGASINGIFQLLSKDFIKPVLFAFCIVSPIGWWAMNRWLENFAYHIDIAWWMFGLSGLIAVCIALLTVSSQAFRAAVANPISALTDD
jgi:putative ABC transport system permease protein